MDQTDLRSVSSPDTDMQHQDGRSDSDGDSNHSIIPITRCHQYMCAYGGGDDCTKAGNVYLCGKCPELYFCEQCLSEGAHTRHKCFLNLWTGT